MLDITMEVGTTVPIIVLLSVSDLVLLSREDAASGAAQLPKCAPGIGRPVWAVASALASHTAKAQGKVDVKLENKPPHPNDQQCGSWVYRRRCRQGQGNCASFWLLDSVLTSSTHPVYLRLGPGCVDSFCSLLPGTCDTEVHQEGLLILFLFIITFHFQQGNCLLFQKCLSSVDLTQGHHCLSQGNQPAALGHATSPRGC